MKYYERYKEMGAKWHELPIERIIELTEGSGYWKQGTVNFLLDNNLPVFTPFAEYKALYK